MRDDIRKFRSERGVSLIETLVVIVIISIVLAIALMQSAPANAQLQRQNVARELKVELERARFDSVKRRATSGNLARVIIDANSYTLETDSNNDGTFESIVTNFSAQNIVIAGSGIALPVTVQFNQRGEATALSSSGTNPVFYICNVTCSSPNNSNANLLLVTATGTVNLLSGGGSAPTFANANVTSISSTSGISNTVSLP